MGAIEGQYFQLHTAVDLLADKLDNFDIGGEEAFGEWGCDEIDVLADVLEKAGREETAKSVIAWHAARDDRGDAHYIGESFVPDQKVIYRAPHVGMNEPGEEGVVVRDEGLPYVHVRYGNDVYAKATPRTCLWSIGGGQ